MFIFASLVAPLGGPPFFFITGIAGGFGFNRALPDPALMLDHPFLKVMRGEIDISGPAADVLKDLSSKHFPVQRGQHWIAAGIAFTAFSVGVSWLSYALIERPGQARLRQLLCGKRPGKVTPPAFAESGAEATR